MKHTATILLSLCLLASCGNHVTPEKKPIGENKLVNGYSHSYGAHYKSRGINQNVVDLDLYSANIDLDSAHHIVGTGTNLYISDIFLPAGETTMQATTYTSDTTADEFTFLPGVDYEGNISGAYLLRITDGKLTGYTIFDEGQFTLLQDGDTTSILFSLKYKEGKNIINTYEAEFKGIIAYD